MRKSVHKKSIDNKAKLLKFSVLSMLFLAFFLITYIAVSTMVRMDSPSASNYTGVNETLSYGYEQMYVSELSDWIKDTSARMSADGDAVSKIVRIRTGEECRISLSREFGSILDVEGNPANPTAGNTYLVTLRKTADSGGKTSFKAYFVRIDGDVQERRYAGICGAETTDKIFVAFVEKEEQNEWRYGIIGNTSREGDLQSLSLNHLDSLKNWRITAVSFDSDADGTLDSVFTGYMSEKDDNGWRYSILKNGEKVVDNEYISKQWGKQLARDPIEATAFDSNNDGTPDSIFVVFADYKNDNEYKYAIIKSDGSFLQIDDKDTASLANMWSHNFNSLHVTVSAFKPSADAPDKILVVFADPQNSNKWSYSIFKSNGEKEIHRQKLSDQSRMSLKGLQVDSSAFDSNGDGYLDKVLVAFADAKFSRVAYDVFDQNGNSGEVKTVNSMKLTANLIWDMIQDARSLITIGDTNANSFMPIKTVAFDSNQDGTLNSVLIAYADGTGWHYNIVTSENGILQHPSAGSICGTLENYADRNIEITAFDSNNDGSPDSIFAAYINTEGANSWKYSIINSTGDVVKRAELADLSWHYTDNLHLTVSAYDPLGKDGPDKIFVAFANPKNTNNWEYSIIRSDGSKEKSQIELKGMGFDYMKGLWITSAPYKSSGDEE